MFEDINSIYDMIDVKYDFDVTTMLSKLIMHEHHIQPLIVPGLFVTHKHKPSIIIYDHDAISYNAYTAAQFPLQCLQSFVKNIIFLPTFRFTNKILLRVIYNRLLECCEETNFV